MAGGLLVVVELPVVAGLPVEAGGRTGVTLLLAPGLTTGGRLVVDGVPLTGAVLTGVVLTGVLTALFTGRCAPLLAGLPALLGLLAGRAVL